MTTKNIVEINDTDIDLSKIIPENNKVESSSTFAPTQQHNEDLITKMFTPDIKTKIITDKYNKLIENAKTPQQLKKEQISSEAPEARRLRLLILNRYKLSQRFGQYLSDLGFKLDNSQLSTLTIPELDSLINDIRFCVSTKNVNSFWQDACVDGIGVAERIISPFYNVTGLRQVVSHDDTYKDVCEELILEHQNYLYCKPEYRLLYCVVKNGSLVHEQHNFFKTEEGKKVIVTYKKQMQRDNQGPIEENVSLSPGGESKEKELNIAPRNIPNIEVKYKDLLK